MAFWYFSEWDGFDMRTAQGWRFDGETGQTAINPCLITSCSTSMARRWAIAEHPEAGGMLLDNYCSRLGSAVEYRYSSLALLEARKQAEKAAAVAQEAMLQAQAADRAKSKFLANMAHELRTPLNAIIGFSEVIKLDRDEMRARYPEYAGYIYEAGSILLNIINGLLDLAQIEAGRVSLREEHVAVGGLIEAAINTIRPLAQRKSIDVDSTIEEPSTTVYVDTTKFKQVLINILSNAVKFTQAQGHIEVEAIARNSRDLVLSIADTGIGIPPEQLEKVLQPFEQVADHLTREHDGTGLGLPIAKALVELHGGELVLSSQLGAGTTVRIHLPGNRVGSAGTSRAAKDAGDHRPAAYRQAPSDTHHRRLAK